MLPLKKTFFHVHNVFRLQHISKLHPDRIHGSISVATPDFDSALRSARSKTATDSEPLHQRHLALEPKRARMLHLAVDVEHRHARNEQDITFADIQVLARIPALQQGDEIDLVTGVSVHALL